MEKSIRGQIYLCLRTKRSSTSLSIEIYIYIYIYIFRRGNFERSTHLLPLFFELTRANLYRPEHFVLFKNRLTIFVIGVDAVFTVQLNGSGVAEIYATPWFCWRRTRLLVHRWLNKGYNTSIFEHKTVVNLLQLSIGWQEIKS